LKLRSHVGTVHPEERVRRRGRIEEGERGNEGRQRREERGRRTEG
jgi:hypothetical protein